MKDRNWFKEMIDTTVENLLDDDDKTHYDSTETYFVDFLREPPEATGDEPDDFIFEAPKIYEEMPRLKFNSFFIVLANK